MTDEQKFVSRWLYSLNRTEWALENLQKSIDIMENKIGGGVIGSTTYDGIFSSTHAVSSPSESKAISTIGDPERLAYLKILREVYQDDLICYADTIDRMTYGEHWGPLGKDIIHAKYIKRVSPDSKIYDYVVFCGKTTFYKTLRLSLNFFYDVLPQKMRTNCELNKRKSVIN